MPPATNHHRASLPPVLRAFLVAVLAFQVLCFGAEFFCSHVLHIQQYTYVRPTLQDWDDYADAKMFVGRFHHFHDPSFFSPQWGGHFLYPAPDAFFYRFFEYSPHPTDTFELAIILICIGLAFWLKRELVRRGLSKEQAYLFAGVSLLTSYPFFVEFNRGNVELFVWGLSALGLLAFFRDRPWLAATLIGLAGACKGYPFIYLGLLFARKQYWQTAYGVLLGFAVNFFSFWAIADSFAIGKQGVAAGLDEFRQVYVLRWNAVGLDHSIFAFIKRFWTPLPPPDKLAHVLTFYLATAAIIACAAYFLRAYRMPPVNQVLFLSVAAITLPPTSYDYTLMHLYPAWVLLVFLAVSAWRSGERLPHGVWPAFVCFMLLLSFQNEFIFHGERFEGQMKCIALLALAIIALRFPFHAAPPAEPIGT